MKRRHFIRITALFLMLALIFTLGGCTSGRTMSTGSTAGDSETDWDEYFNSGGSNTVIGSNSGNGNNNNNGNNGSGNNSGNTLVQNSDKVIDSDEFPWPDLKFSSDTITVLSYDVDESSWEVERKILEEQYGLKVQEVNSSYNEVYPKFQQMHAAGNAPDAVIGKCYSHIYLSMALKGMLREVDEVIDLTDENLWGDLISAYSQTKYNGHNYMLYQSMTRGPYIFYNKKLFRDAGVDDLWETYKANPASWDWNKLKEIGVKLTDTSSGVVGLATDDGNSFFHTTGQRFGEWGTTRATTKSNMKNQAFARAAEYITQGRTDGWINTAVQNSGDVFGNELAAMVFAQVGYNSRWSDIAKRGDLGIVPMAKDPEADYLWNFKSLFGYLLPTNSKNPNGGLAFALAARYASVTDEGLAEEEAHLREEGLTDLNIQQLFEPDKAGQPIIDLGQNLGYTNVWNCLLHKYPWSSTFTGSTQNTTNQYIDEVFAGVE